MKISLVFYFYKPLTKVQVDEIHWLKLVLSFAEALLVLWKTSRCALYGYQLYNRSSILL